MKMRFNLGKLVCTMGVSDAMNDNPKFVEFVNCSLARHINCDWGDLCDEDKEMNNSALVNGDDRLFSRYDFGNGVSIYIITEWDRSYTTVLFPDEY